jgi:hypothetical protein
MGFVKSGWTELEKISHEAQPEKTQKQVKFKKVGNTNQPNSRVE